MDKELIAEIFHNNLDVDIYKDYLSKINYKQLSYIEFFELLENENITINSLNRLKRLKKLKECFGNDLNYEN